jgi:glycerol-3-phosphate dehydrogenase (NAD(P)+)
VKFKRTAVLGAGSWGTALAVLWAKCGNDVTLWGHNGERAEQLRETRENADYLPGIKLPPSIHVTSDIRDCANAELIVVVTPSVAVRATLEQAREFIARDAVLLSCTRGSSTAADCE